MRVSTQTLDLAVARAILSAEQRDQLLALASRDGDISVVEPSDEGLRFVTGFADVFVTIGILLFVGALAYFMGTGAGTTPMFAGTACCTWLLAEHFSGRKRMALPSIVLLLLFVAAVLMVSLQVFGSLIPTPAHLPARFWFLPSDNPAALAVASICTAALAAMHYARFRVPITVAVGCAALCLLALGLALTIEPNLGLVGMNAALLMLGLCVFAFAMRLDLNDPARVTRRSDIAFWLHLLAAPLIVHPALAAFLGGARPQPTVGAALGVLWAFLLLGLVAVVIDRRALLVSALLYAGFALATLLRAYGGIEESNHLLPLVLLLLGAFILLLSAGWQPLRRALLRRMPLVLSNRLAQPPVIPRP